MHIYFTKFRSTSNLYMENYNFHQDNNSRKPRYYVDILLFSIIFNNMTMLNNNNVYVQFIHKLINNKICLYADECNNTLPISIV